MTDVTPPPAQAMRSDDTRTLVIVVYGLYLAALLCVGLSGIAGVILAYIKRDEVRGTMWESHFENAIHTFWVWLGLSVIGILTVWLVIGIFILIGAYVYFAYRTIKGLIGALDSKPMSEARTDAPAGEDLRAIALIAYGLLVLATFNGLTAIAAVVLAYIKRDAARGTPWESHFRNIIHVFWIALIVSMVALALALQAFGGLAFSMITTDGHPPPAAIGLAVMLVPVFLTGGAIFFVWFLYRTLRGLIHTIEARPF